ncbi:MAG: lipopolysaccharide heptosyltransferase I [Dissulfurispiraceae bacterium]|jgi:lipopolysaccharide heptosyltransferase I|nr:lipopolysaccharide heptosyltransferase I [Dissulfurispiraceae bacterium]
MKKAIKNPPEKILIIKPSSLGDVIHSLPFLNAIRNKFLQSEIHWIIAKGFESIVEGHPMINKIWVIDKDRWKKISRLRQTVFELKDIFRSLRNEKYDLAIDLQGLFRSGVMMKAALAPVRIGFKEAREGSCFFYTHKVMGGRNIHAVDRYLRIAAELGCDISDPQFPMPDIQETENVRSIKQLTGRYSVIIPGARKEANKWPADRYAELGSRLKKNFLVIGGRADEGLCKKIEDQSSGFARSIAGKTDLLELAAIIRSADYVVSNDTGPMHIAAAFGIPVVAIFGPANPVRTGPYGSGHVIVQSGLDCAPCYKRRCRDPECMTAITVDMVYDAVAKRFQEEK